MCDECCSVHRSLGRHISIVKHLRHSAWPPTLLQVLGWVRWFLFPTECAERRHLSLTPKHTALSSLQLLGSSTQLGQNVTLTPSTLCSPAQRQLPGLESHRPGLSHGSATYAWPRSIEQVV